jgi:hypothetical protein
MAGSVQIWPAFDHSSGDGDWMLPDSGAGKFSVVGCCQILVPARFRRPTIAEFRQLDIKYTCKNEAFNFGTIYGF